MNLRTLYHWLCKHIPRHSPLTRNWNFNQITHYWCMYTSQFHIVNSCSGIYYPVDVKNYKKSDNPHPYHQIANNTMTVFSFNREIMLNCLQANVWVLEYSFVFCTVRTMIIRMHLEKYEFKITYFIFNSFYKKTNACTILSIPYKVVTFILNKEFLLIHKEVFTSIVYIKWWTCIKYWIPDLQFF